MPIAFYWDTDDSRLFVCESRSIQHKTTNTTSITTTTMNKSPAHSSSSNQNSKTISSNASEFAESQVNIMFVTDKSEIKELEIVNLMSGEKLVNLCVPNVVSKMNMV